MTLAKVAQEILQHASTGPSTTPGQKVRNTLSPHMERFITECIRAHLINEAKVVQRSVAQEMSSLAAIFPQPLAGHIEYSAAKINSIIQQIYK